MSRAAPILAVALATLLLGAALTGVFLRKHGGDVSALTCTGGNRAGGWPYDHVSRPVGPNGYDGQFYYAIAQGPWRTHADERIDVPAGRHVRVLYPAACWLLSGGDPWRLLWVMPLVNLLALAGLGGLGAWFALRQGWPAWWGLTLPLGVNAAQPVLRDLTDPLSTLAVAGLLAGWLAGARAAVLAGCALAALLAREQNVLVVGVVGLAALWQGRRGLVVGLAAAVLLWAGWVAVLWSAYGYRPFLPADGNLGAPFAGMLYRWQHPGGNDYFSRRLACFYVPSMAHLTALLGLAVYLAARPGSGVVRLCLLFGVALAVTAGPLVYGDFWSYTRVFVWVPLGVWLSGLLTQTRWLVCALLPAAVWPVAAALGYV